MNNQSDLYHVYPAKFNGLIALISRYNLTWLIIKNVEVEGIKTDVTDILQSKGLYGQYLNLKSGTVLLKFCRKHRLLRRPKN